MLTASKQRSRRTLRQLLYRCACALTHTASKALLSALQFVGRAGPAPAPSRPHAIALHSGTLRCVRKKRTRGAGRRRTQAATGRLPPTQSLPDARKSTPPPHAGRTRHFSTRAKLPRTCYELWISASADNFHMSFPVSKIYYNNIVDV